MLRQEVPKIGLSLLEGVEGVPDDGYYYLVLKGEVVHRTRSKARALEEYRKRRDDLMEGMPPEKPPIDGAEALRRERMRSDVEAMQAEARNSKRRKALRKGGKGGSGGVG